MNHPIESFFTNYANQISSDDDFPEVSIQVYKFNLMEYTVHCVLLESQVEVMKKFFQEISTGKVLWETAKSKALLELFKSECPNLTEEQILKMQQFNPGLFVRSNAVFRDLESNSNIQNIIREFKINQITD